jgi:integrase
MGYLYRPRLKSGGRGAIWWVKYYANGRPVRESAGTDKETEARRFLKEREGRVATGQPILPRVDRIRYEELSDDLVRHYEATGRRNLREARIRLAHLARFFANRRVASLSTTDLTSYIVKRQSEKVANATINRELATLSRMFAVGYKAGKVLRPPVIERLREAPPRQGFFERDRFLSVRKNLPLDLQVAVTIAYTYGWRTPSEVLTLERRQLDLEAGTLRLDPGTTKNDDGRLVYLTPELKTMLTAQLARVRTLERKLRRIVVFLFPHLDGDEIGTRRRDIRSAWRTACKKAGCPQMLTHDFRRTAVRNMVNAGVPERVAMKVTGHKTRAVFDRYHIVSPGDLRDAAARIARSIGSGERKN